MHFVGHASPDVPSNLNGWIWMNSVPLSRGKFRSCLRIFKVHGFVTNDVPMIYTAQCFNLRTYVRVVKKCSPISTKKAWQCVSCEHEDEWRTTNGVYSPFGNLNYFDSVILTFTMICHSINFAETTFANAGGEGDICGLSFRFPCIHDANKASNRRKLVKWLLQRVRVNLPNPVSEIKWEKENQCGDRQITNVSL